jgi:hypothetical protein
MVTCPNCHHQELPGALFCSECGAQLVTMDRSATQTLDVSPSDYFEKRHSKPLSSSLMTSPGPELTISLRIMDSGDIIRLSGRTEVTLGRIVEGQPILPDIDLSPYEAYAHGVSRLHAALKVNPQRVAIMDLGSSNGTRVNGQKIVPHIDYPLKDQDIVALGKLKIQILIQ